MQTNKQHSSMRPEIRSGRSKVRPLIFIVLIIICSACTSKQSPGVEPESYTSHEDQFNLPAFELHLESVRQALKIPGMSAAVVRDQELLWAAGFGYADLENQVPAGPDTPYGLASVTKPVASVLFMQLVEGGKIDLDAPVSLYGVNAGDERVTSRHLLTHTSEGTPGTNHLYNGDRYALLQGVMEAATGKSFAQLLSERVLLPLDMKSTALNPISTWQAGSGGGLEDLYLVSGFGSNFEHYPGVYQRLSKPYQFDQDYNIVPGKYHLNHQPAAGLISSAIDLAKFDIALDNRVLLNEASQAEMFSPAFSTYRNRSDLMYGLGWYTQEFDGLRLNWHSGRWPPSTSALYLKVPEMNLTFIVLANTDNLTVPFYGIGNGDVSQSALALTFFKYFIFPQRYGRSLPEIDWSGTEQEILKQLSVVENAEEREFLERELWSFRQAFASIGNDDQVNRLLMVNIRAYPRSKFRHDELFTNLPGKYPLIPPALPASAYLWFGRLTAVWLMLVIFSVAIMGIKLLKAQNLPWLGKLIWLVFTLFLGPLAILIQALTKTESSNKTLKEWQLALRASVLLMTGYTLAWIPAITLLTSFGNDPHPLAVLGTTYLIPFLASLFLIRIALPASIPGLGNKFDFKNSLLVEFISFNLGFAVLFSLTWVYSSRLLTSIPNLTSPFFWVMLSIIASSGVLLLFPLHYWLIHRGCKIPTDQLTGESQSFTSPTLRVSWPILLATLGIMIAALAATISQVA